MVTVGGWVTVQDDGQEEIWRIVPAIEADPLRQWISQECPLARALVGHAPGDVVQVRGPAGRRTVTVLAVQAVAGW